jgi:subtilisin family serine protease
MGPDLWELYEYGEADDEVAAIIRLARFGALPPGVRVIAQFEEIVTARLQRGDIPRISGAQETAGMSSGDTYLGADLELENEEGSHESLPRASAMPTDLRRPENIAMTGRGVVVGVVDWGFDFRHPDFRKPDGSSRILALWDQRGGKRADSPQPYGYGTVHTREAINRALAAPAPYAQLNYHPADADTGNGCHGTHVAAIAAGTGGDGRPAGIAPEADLVFVHHAPWDNLERGKLGDSVTLLEAIDFIARTAAGRPWVINLSMGRHGEQHDGTTLIEQGLDAAVRMAAGRAICLSAGNYYNKRTHASGQLRPTQSRTLAWIVNEKIPSDYNQLEIWYSWQDKFEITVRSPDGSIEAHARLGEKVKLISGGREIGNLYHRAQEPNTLDHHVTLYLYKNAPAGEWSVTLKGLDVIHGDYHAWIEREVSCPRCQSRFKASDADPTSTTGTICNGRRTIAVGAYDPHDPGHRIGAFSSVGPTRDGRLKPDLCAPGVDVLAARSAGREHPEDTPLLTRMSGTSMAAPHVAGAVALAFQAAVRPLRIEETHNLLLGSARRVAVEDRDPDRVGIGFLDVVALVEAAGKVDNGQRTFVPVRATESAVEAVAEAEVASASEAASFAETLLEHAVMESLDSYPDSFALPDAEPTSHRSYPSSFALLEAESACSAGNCRCANHAHTEVHTRARGGLFAEDTAPAPASAPASIEARLRALLTGSMVLAGNARAPFLARALPSGAQAGSLWRYELGFASSGELKARNVTCRVLHSAGSTAHVMAMGVLESVVWRDVYVRLGTDPNVVTLPLRAAHLIGSFQTPAGRIPATTHPVWRLESTHDVGTAVVFGFDLTDPGRPAPLGNLDDFARERAHSGRAPRVLVVCELVLCQGRADFEPGGVLEAARVYPIAEVITDGDADIQMQIELLRPDRSAMDHGWDRRARGAHLPSLYVDRNAGSPLVEFARAVVTGSGAVVPGWSTFFDYYDRNTSRAAIRFVAVDPSKTGTRTDSSNREIIDRVNGTYSASVVTKVPRQGEFDNIHIAPQMEAVIGPTHVPLPVPITIPGIGPIPVSMAPVCAHDCFHLHWRWGQGYMPIQNLGWGARGAYTEAGAPMVAPNQKIECETPSGRPGLHYRATATRQRGGDWAYVLPHGGAYALQLAVDPARALDRLLSQLPRELAPLRAPIVSWVGSAADRAWAWIYFFFQYTPTLRAPHVADVIRLHSLSALRRL